MCCGWKKKTNEMQMVKTYFLGSFVKGRNSQEFWATVASYKSILQFFFFVYNFILSKKRRNFFKNLSDVKRGKQSVEQFGNGRKNVSGFEHAFIPFLFSSSKIILLNTITSGDFRFQGGVMNFFQSHSKGLYTDPNDCMNHPK